LAGSGLFALLDDIASLLDDVALLTKVAAKKTAGVLGDDLALNAHQVSGVRAQRELPVVWAVAKGSLVNKAILVGIALAISRLASWLVEPMLMLGGAFLCFEGCEKLAHKFLHGADEDAQARAEELRVARLVPQSARLVPETEILALESEQIKGAIRTDFVLSAEIITITLGAVERYSFATQALVLVGTGVLMTFAVYGVVAAIVKLDDVGLYLSRWQGAGLVTRAGRSFGRFLLRLAPSLMKALSVAGALAVFLVGGGILAHGFPPVHRAIDAVTEAVRGLSGVGHTLALPTQLVLESLTGVAVGMAVLIVVVLVSRLRGRH